MAYYRCGGGGLPAGLQTNMDAVLNKKFSTSTTYPPADWPDTVNLMGMLPEKTVSGAIAVIEDGADDVPTKSVKITIPASLSGVSAVSVVQTGRNLMTAPTYSASTESLCLDLGRDISGVSVTLSFLATNSVVDNVTSAIVDFRESNGTHHYRTLNDFKDDNNISFSSSNPNNGVFKYTSTYTFRYVYISYTSNWRSKFTSDSLSDWQLELGSTAHAYTPYIAPTTYTASLGRTIYGGEVDIVNGVGKTKVYKQTYTGDNVGTASITYGQADEGYTHLYFNIADIPLAYNPTSDNVISNITLPWNNNASAAGIPSVGECWRLINGGSPQKPIIYMYIHQTWSNLSDFKTWLNANPITIVYEVADETDFTFTGQEVPTRLGYNAFWSEQGDTEVTYRRDIDLALGGN